SWQKRGWDEPTRRNRRKEPAGGKMATAPPSGRLWARDWRRSARQGKAHPRQGVRWPASQPRWPREERGVALWKKDPNRKNAIFRPTRTSMKAILVLMESL